jgi:uncharacterized membrane protein
MQSEAYERVEAHLREAVHWAQLAVEVAGAGVIALGVTLAVLAFFRTVASGKAGGYQRVRLTLAHYLAVALEFLLAADILATAVSPTWDQIGKLAAIAAIRTALNFFLMREMKAEAEELGGPGGHRDEVLSEGADR